MKVTTRHISAVAIAVASALNFIGLLLWTRLLTPVDFGVYTLVSATSLLVNAFVFEWLRQTGARLLFSAADPLELDPQTSNTLAAICLMLATVLGLVALLMWIAQLRIFGLAPYWWLLIWLWVLSEMLFALCSITARLRLLSWRFFWLMTLRAAVSLALGAGLVAVFDLGALGVTVGTIAAQFAISIVAAVTDAAWKRIRPWRATYGEARKILDFGLPLILSTGLVFLAGISDRYIISATLGIEATGQYSVASDLMQKTVIFVMLAINITAYPQIVRAFESQGNQEGARRLAQNFETLLLVSLPVAVTFGVMSHGLARLFVGAAFEDSMALLLPWVAVAAVMRGLMTFHLSVALQAVKKTRILVAAPLITLAVLIPAGLIGVKLNGLQGVAISVAFAQTASFVIFARIVGKNVGVSMLSRGSVLAVVLAFALGVGLLPFRSVTETVNLIGVISAALLLYGLVAWRFKVATFR
ncbi:lipopolysaccharide biosynthesis protein [Pseudotabrizicola algicola]|uniref:Lipopolysaccharide biosynthesis protein n=1 Tax=Pseudotabrizicola algicola TaxID=2709381 RepID=A0A6B3RS19_9RHOB|nr:lipopolysaccharide biosynthesis protein [Pseudotabrizicola algicola]NEX45852.1 lipopolysaccharide biosynthesis protein [Pseudotabrizicola algicola]